MNGKKAKLLRKLVSYYKADQPAEYLKQFKKTKRFELGIDPTTGLPKIISVDRYQTKLEPSSSRARYQTLKQAVKAGSVKVERQAV